MSNNSVISKEAQVLLKLLHLALDIQPKTDFGEPIEPFPDGIDWKEVTRLSYKHKVSALATDGLKASGYDIYKGLSKAQIQQLKPIADSWVKDVSVIEKSYDYYAEVVRLLCRIFIDNGLVPIVLKGYGLSRNYPTPSHRGNGDIDIYLMDKDGNLAAKRGDEIANTILGLQIKEDPQQHHSQFLFKGVLVENHYEVFDPFYKCERFEPLTTFLLQELKNKPNTERIDCYPSPNFNAVFQIMHLYNHICFSYFNLRQIIDYLLFVRACNKDVDWNIVERVLAATQLLDFRNGVHRFISKYLLKEDNVSIWNSESDAMCRCVEQSLFKMRVTKNWKDKFFQYYDNRFMLKHLYHKNWLIMTCRMVINRLVKKQLFPNSLYSNITKSYQRQ